MSNVTQIGLGAMGMALARALVNGGHTTTVWNRSQSKIDHAISIGAIGASNVAEAVQASDTILVCLSNYSVTRSVLDTDEARSHLASKTLVQMGTVTPAEARESESWMKNLGGNYLDVTIQPYPEEIGEPDSQFLISGSEVAYEQALPFLRLFGGNLRYLGKNVGAASTLDLGKLICCLSIYVGFAHAARICETESVGLDQFALLFTEKGLGRNLAERIHADNYKVGAIHPGASIRTWEGCIQVIQDHARFNKINSEVPDFIASIFSRALESGYGEEDIAAIVKVLRQATQSP